MGSRVLWLRTASRVLGLSVVVPAEPIVFIDAIGGVAIQALATGPFAYATCEIDCVASAIVDDEFANADLSIDALASSVIDDEFLQVSPEMQSVGGAVLVAEGA